MKLTIPSECMIGAIKFSIVWDEKLLKKMELAAHISSVDQKIYLSHRHPDQEWVNLIHEILHGIMFSFDINTEDDKVERYLSSLANGLVIFLNSIGIEPDFSQIEEEK